LVVLALIAVLFMLVIITPIRLEVGLRLSEAHANLWLEFSVAGILKWCVNVPPAWLMPTGEGLGLRAHIQVSPGQQEAQVTETLTPEMLSEESKVDESILHNVLAGIDVVQMLLGIADGKDRALGSPWLHLIVIPFSILGRHLRCLEFRWETRIGVGDACVTALVVGMLWGLKSSLLALMEQRLVLTSRPIAHVTPNFNGTELATELLCIFHLSVGQIMWRTLCDAAQRWQRKGAGVYGG
jgi:hypothetical protein